ncbi:MAG: alanine racemase [Candidatus Bathyarchaeia archaeon]
MKSEIDTPALIVDLDVMERNIKDMARCARDAGVKLRPMTKTHKCPAISALQIAHGASGIQVAKLSEGEVMEAAGIRDLFISNEIIGAPKIERLIKLARRANVRAGIDSVEGARAMNEAALNAGVTLNVRIDVDTGLGRTGTLPGEPTLRLAREVSRMKGLHLEGIFTHEGIVYTATSRQMLEDLSVKAAKDMVDTAEMMREQGIPCEEVSLGSTNGAKITAKVPGVTEIRPGAYVFYDVMQWRWYGVCRMEDCAATAITTIISRPSSDRAICDAGDKSAGPDAAGFGTFRPPNVQPVMAVVKTLDGKVVDDAFFDSTIGEEYGLMKLSGSFQPKIGEKYELIPVHVCGLIMLHDQLTGVRGGEVECVWPISARGKFT